MRLKWTPGSPDSLSAAPDVPAQRPVGGGLGPLPEGMRRKRRALEHPSLPQRHRLSVPSRPGLAFRPGGELPCGKVQVWEAVEPERGSLATAQVSDPGPVRWGGRYCLCNRTCLVPVLCPCCFTWVLGHFRGRLEA